MSLSNVSNIPILLNNTQPQIINQNNSTVPSSLLDVLKTDPTLKNKRKLTKEFKALSIDQLSVTLDSYFHYLAEQGSFDLEKAAHRLSDMIPLKKLEAAIRLEYPNHRNALHTAKTLLKEAQHYLEISEHKTEFSLIKPFKKVLDSLIIFLESIIGAFGIADFFKPAESDVQANTKSQRIFILISLFGVLTAALIPALGAAITAPVVAGSLLAWAALSVIYPFIKPMPHHIHKAVYWTQLIQNGKLPAVQSNRKYLDQIAQALNPGEKVKTHPMLIGKSGVGKTETVKAFAHAVENGDYPELKGKKIFYINSADLLNGPGKQEGGNKELQKISECMGRHRKNIILIFDEIHILCQKKNNVLAEQMKTLLDDAHEGFSHVIGITTQQEYYRDIYRNNAAFARRFKQINIANAEDDEVEQILGKTLIQKAPTALIDNNALKYLNEETKKAFPQAAQPAGSIKILSQCIQQISEMQHSVFEEKINNVQKEIDLINTKNMMGHGNDLLPYNRENSDKITELEDQLTGLEKEFNSYQKEVEQLYLNREKLGDTKRKTYKDILKITRFSKHLWGRDKKLKQFLLTSHYIMPMMEKNIRQNADLLNVHAIINKSLIDDVILGEKENQKKVDQAVEVGKEEVKAREAN